MNINILIVGVGGQGTLLASRILGNLAQTKGRACKLSEVHGMSQRGGSVVTHVRIGDEVHSPIISPKQADVIIAFEKLEALRWRHYLKPQGIMIINDQEIMPMPVIIGTIDYPQDIFSILEMEGISYKRVKALDKAKEAGTVRAVNTVMLGALAKLIDIELAEMEQALILSVKPQFIEVNKKALELGYKL